MKTRIDLSPYEKMYESFDKGHDSKHLIEVRDFAIKLGKKYCPDKLEIIYIAATLHDIGLSMGREGHELNGYKIIKKDKAIKSAYSKEEFKEILDAIKEHRASSGNPQTLVGKIVSDADKISGSTNRAFQRAYEWGKKHFPTINHDGQLLRAAQHLYIKFGPNGTGSRVYFKESRERQERTYKPIFEALEKDDLNKLNTFLADFILEYV